jgi:CBS domain containing-hemolysin-like protein
MDSNLTSDQQESSGSGGILKKILNFFNFGRPGTKEDLEHEIQELLEEGEEHGLITSLEEKMISSIFDFRDTSAAEVMTPAAEVVSFDEAQPISDLINIIIDNGLTRIPIYRDNPDQVIGVVHAKDLLAFCTSPDREKEQLEKYLRPVSFVSETKPIVDLLPEFQKRKEHMAMVTDEFGTIRGLITLEDILEEIVGEIDDEYDVKQVRIEEVGPGSIRVHARVDIEKIEEYFKTEFPEGPYESIGGMIIHALGRLARPGDHVRIAGFSFEVESATERHLQSVLITRLPRKE